MRNSSLLQKNPELESYYRLLTQSRVELGLLSEKTRNKGAERWMQSITTLVNKKRLRATNMFFMTVLWQSDFPTNCDLFEANCGSVKPRWRDYFSRIVDVGLFGHWLLLEQRMEDFDVNHEEFDMPYKSGMTIQLQA